MVEVKEVTKENIIDLYKVCCPNEESYMSAMQESTRHFLKKTDKGWKGFVVYEDDGVVGRAEIAPIEESLVALEGEDVYFLYCIWVKKEAEGKNYGRKLMEKIIEVAKEKKGLATIVIEGWMPKKFFEHFGFESVKSMGPVDLMLKKFDRQAKAEFAQVEFHPEISLNKVNITVVHSLRCPYMMVSYNKAIETVKNVSDRVVVTEHILKTQSDVFRYGDENFYIDDEAPFMGPINTEKLQEIIKIKLKEKMRNA